MQALMAGMRQMKWAMHFCTMSTGKRYGVVPYYDLMRRQDELRSLEACHEFVDKLPKDVRWRWTVRVIPEGKTHRESELYQTYPWSGVQNDTSEKMRAYLNMIGALYGAGTSSSTRRRALEKLEELCNAFKG